MTIVLIIESNTPELLAGGKSASAFFLRSLHGLDASLTLKVVCPYAAPPPADIYDGVDGIIYTGSGVNWATDAPEAAPLRAEMERSFEQNLPVWGSCNGLQLAAVVLGGTVAASPNGFEIGPARDIRLSKEGAAHPMMTGRESGFSAPCVHRDEVRTLPDGATLIAGNSHSPVQAMTYGKGGVDFWGTQYHPEMRMADIAASTGGRGLFSGGTDLTADLSSADTDDAAARRLGTSTEQLALETRATELSNWLAHVKARRA
ncbi:type 1 glutamine amidotransferase [Shimia aestuarii]|uniref:GMP synthase (Glutamine-hydrolysing) n=1 Tax=Shimia aestuarii TaxID=254406 RepID=A0A1I4JUM6_9RHOB|nr:type 1 glutamine amidotransferase [Shimia aestuarii]SFL70041.1 GMP synthase (glutamine-hydrolysing) [Shimia aestuarii]